MDRICSWLSNESFRFFNGVVRFEIMNWTGGGLRRTVTRAQHLIRHIFSPRPPTVHSNKPSYAQESSGFIAIVQSPTHPQTVHICAQKGANTYYGQIVVRWLNNPPIYSKYISDMYSWSWRSYPVSKYWPKVRSSQGQTGEKKCKKILEDILRTMGSFISGLFAFRSAHMAHEFAGHRSRATMHPILIRMHRQTYS